MAIKLSEKQINDGWKIVRFDDIAKNISKRVDPTATDLEVYVGLEHLDPQSLRITRHGVPSDVKGQKLRVGPGQIIFGKRRAYQKKLAVADFEGICSAHAMVLEEITDNIIPGLLPFFMQSDMFMDRAVAISEGSLSPTIKWKTLAVQKFPLPPMERQKAILEVLEKVEECLFNTYELLIIATQIFSATLKREVYKSNGRKMMKIGQCAKCLDNLRVPLNDKDRSGKKGVYSYWGANGVVDYIDEYIFDFETILLAEDGGYFDQFNDRPIANIAEGKYWVNNHAHVLRPKENITLRWLYYSLVHKNIQGYINMGTRAKLNKKDMMQIPIILPPIEEQEKICRVLNGQKSIIDALNSKSTPMFKNKRTIIDEVLYGGNQ